MAEEIELKLSISPADHRRLQAHPLLRAVTQRTDQMLDNVYFDTPDLALRKKGVALRLRKQGRQRLQTIKLATKAVAGSGLSSRPEWEHPFREHFDFSVVDVPAIREWLLQPEISACIRPLFQTRFRRITWILPIDAGGEVVVAFDRGYVSVIMDGKEQRDEISEVELELSGSRNIDALHAVAAQLRERVNLQPSDISKAHRGYAMLGHVTSTP